MSRSRVSFPLLIFSATVLCAAAKPALTQEISLVPFDTTEVAKGYRANALMLKRVVNDKAESIGTIDDFMFGRDGGVFAILAVGDFIGTAATSSPSPSRASSSTIRAATLSCPALVAKLC